MEPESEVIATRSLRSGAFSALAEQRTLANQKLKDKPTQSSAIGIRFIAVSTPIVPTHGQLAVLRYILTNPPAVNKLMKKTRAIMRSQTDCSES
jgi:hypothetical protein